MKKNYIAFLIILFVYSSAMAQVFVDFESAATTPPLSCEGNTARVTDNPDPSGINTSAKVGYYQKMKGNWHYVQMDFPDKYPIKTNNTLKFKVYCSQQGRIFAKFWNNGNVLIESWAPEWNFKPEPNKWVQCEMDMTPAMNKEFDILQIAACVDNDEVAEVYFDDFELSNPDIGDGSPKVSFTVSKTRIQTGEMVSFDASTSFDYDGTINQYNWDFGDGSTGTGKTTEHAYSNAGTYTATLTCIDNDNKSSSKSTYIFAMDATGKLSDLLIVTENPSVYNKIEGVFQVNANYTNVYNPDEVTIDAEITNPDGTKYSMPCFYFINSINQKNTWVIDSSYQAWMLRFTSAQTGLHKIKITLTDADGSIISPEYTVNVASSDAKGFVHRDANNKQYYRYSTAEPFYPMGINEAWDLTSNYTKIIGNLSDAGANVIRYWHTPFNKQALEWTKNSFYDGLGKYSQPAAAMTDYLLDLGGEKNMYLQLVLLQHGPFSENVNPMWDTNPYNSANGGFVDKAEKFFYNSACDAQIKKLLRYVVARWAYSTHIFAWEFFNEVQFTGNNPNQTQAWYKGILNWHARMSDYVNSLDPYNHLRTTSVDRRMMIDFDTIPGLDIVQYHLYSDQLLADQKKYDFEYRKTVTKSAVINGEYGTEYLDYDVTMDQQRASIWNSIMNQTPHFAWIWGHYTDPSWANQFELATQFTSGEDFAARGKLEQVSPTTYWDKKELVTSMFRSPDSFYGYVYDETFKTNIKGAYTELTGVPYAYYDVTFYQPISGEVIKNEKVPLVRTRNKINLPPFDKDIAYKIKFNSAYDLPVAIAGEDTTVAPGEIIHLSAIKSTSLSGGALTYQWAVTEKPAASTTNIANATQRDVIFTPDISGTYQISLVVKEGTMNSIPDIITILVSAIPVANAGNDTIVYMDDKNVSLDGSASYDADGDLLTYYWEIIKAPAASSQRLYNYTEANPRLKLDAAGDFLITLVVNDGISSSQPDTIKVTVKEGSYVPSELFTDIRVYPNPVDESLYITNDESFSGSVKIEITDANGKMVYQTIENNVSTIAISMSRMNIPGGIYFVRVSDLKYVSRLKFIYQK